jgi:molecular chaperone GrpE
MQSSRASEDTAAQSQPQADPQPQAAGAQPPDSPHAAGPQPPDSPPAEAGATEELRAELARMEDRYKRALADLDNYRKRAARDVERLIGERREALLRDWLEVVDGMERALQQHPEGPLNEGLRAVLGQMDAILARQGVQRVGQPGEPFDPARHEAIDVRVTDDAPDRTVIDVVRSGYAMDGRVLRPAQVIVARAPQPL